MDEVYQNGHSKVYKEVAEDGTVTEYEEEQYLIESESKPGGGSNELSSEVVVLQDDEDMKVYQQHEVLPDGREVITTTTLTVNEEGEAVEKTVTEIVEEVEVEEEIEVENGAGEDVDDGSMGNESEEESAEKEDTEEVSAEEEVNEECEEEGEEDANEKEEMENKERVDAEEHADVEMEIKKQQDEAESAVAAEVTDTFFEQQTTEETESSEIVEPVKTVSRRISYEDFTEQFTEYKPPKRYEKKQTTTSADKAAPKIRIMTEGDDVDTSDSQGLPSTDSYAAPIVNSGDSVASPRTGSVGDTEEVSLSPQPTRTQGSIIRRMDQDSNVDPANIIRSEDKPDIGAELPSVGTSKSMKSKFQALADGEVKQVDFSQPVKIEKTRKNHNRYVEVDDETPSDHKEPEFEGGEIENTPEVRHDVVREADKNYGEELPEIGQAKNLLSKWSQIEVESKARKEYQPSGVGSKPTVTPMRPSSRVINEPGAEEHVEPQLEGGEYENTPVERTDVVKSSDTVDFAQELPTVGLAKSILSQFSQKEQEAKKVREYQPSGAGNRAPKVTNTPSSSVSSSEPHVEPQFEGGAVENAPVERSDVVRETDVMDTQELPEAGYAKNLKARFRELQEQQRPADYVEHRPSGVAGKATPTPHRLSNTASLSASVNSLSSSTDEVERVEPQLEGGEYENQPIKRTDVIREEDKLDEQELPEAGLARNLTDRFKSLESEKPKSYKPSGVSSKISCVSGLHQLQATPSKLHIMAGKTSYSAKGIVPDSVVSANTTDEVAVAEAGEFENTPTVRDDVVRADTRVENNEMPEQGVTKNIMSRFKSLEVENKSNIEHRPSTVASKPTPTPLRPTSAVVENSESQDDASPTDRLKPEVKMEDDITEVNHNVVRSSDANQDEYIPSAGAAKSLLDN